MNIAQPADQPLRNTLTAVNESEAQHHPQRTLHRSSSAQEDRPASARPVQEHSDLVWNVLTVLVWVLIVCVVMAFLSISANPKSAMSMFQPNAPTLASFVTLPTMTASPQPSATAGVSPTVTLTPIPPTATLSPAPTSIPTETATLGPSPTATIHSLYPFAPRGEIKVIDAATFPDHESCRLWVAGQAYDLQGAPMTGITVMLGGYLDRKTLSQLSLTGTALQYGQAGYEFTVADRPSASKEDVYVQLFDQAMIPLSGRVYFNTAEDCTQNLVLINFRQVR
jgi:hypothetical protein